MNDLVRAIRAFELPHTRRALLLGLSTLVVALPIAWLLGRREWFFARAALLWLVGIVALLQWQLVPLLRHLRRPSRASWGSRVARHPVGALILGILGVAPLVAIAPLLPTRGGRLDGPGGEWQLAGFVAVLLGGLTGLSVWEATVGKMARRRHRSMARRQVSPGVT